MWKSVAAVSIGGMLGCLLRWLLGLQLNNLLPAIIGLAVVFFAINAAVPPEWRLFVTTGFCGGLTTFSTFSAEVVTRLERAQVGTAMAEIGVHLVGSLGATALGVLTIHWILQRG